MNILLVNPNTMKNPPVIPIGLEYLITALKKNGHNADILDLCFSKSPKEELNMALKERPYDITGFTIRNIDSAVYFNNEFYLHAIKPLIQCVKNYDIPVVLGGSGFSAMPFEILEYLQADYGIVGPGEIIFPHFLSLYQNNHLKKKIYNGWDSGVDSKLFHKRGEKIDYSKYLFESGIVGFETHKGCLKQCPYCIEAGTRVWYKNIKNIIKEIEFIVNLGYTHFHLCDSEFNSDLNFSLDFCMALIERELPLKWTLYMVPNPYCKELFKLLYEANAYLITLSVDSDKRIQTLNDYSYKDLAKIIEYCKNYEIELVIDLLTGYPYESIESTKNMLKFFNKHKTKTGISFYYRIYKNTPLSGLIKKDIKLQNKLTKHYYQKENFLEPIFFNQLKREIIEEIIADNDLFHIAGIIPGVNYQLLK
ncbi:MAG: B12-binding domain-containing radical SAM protein [Promethearchaeota archaeon]